MFLAALLCHEKFQSQHCCTSRLIFTRCTASQDLEISINNIGFRLVSKSLDRIQSVYDTAHPSFENIQSAGDYHRIDTLPVVLARTLSTKEMMKPA